MMTKISQVFGVEGGRQAAHAVFQAEGTACAKTQQKERHRRHSGHWNKFFEATKVYADQRDQKQSTQM